MFHKIYTLSKLLGFAPVSSSDNKILIIINVCCFLIYVGSISGWTIGRFMLLDDLHSTTYTVLTTTQTGLQFIFYTLSFVSALFKIKNWKFLLNGLKFEKDVNLKSIEVLLVFFLHFLFIFVVLNEVYAYMICSKTTFVFYISLLFHIRQYFQFVMAYFIHIIAKLIVKNYDNLKKELERFGKKAEMYPQYHRFVLKEIVMFKDSYEGNSYIVQEFNKIFGWQLGIYFIMTVVDILCGISFYINTRNLGNMILMSYASQVFITLVSFQWSEIVVKFSS